MRVFRRQPVFRFSLATFLVLITLLCVWLGTQARRARQQYEAVKWVTSVGGWVSYHYQMDEVKGRVSPGAHPPGPAWLREVVGEDYFTSIHSVYIPGHGQLSGIAILDELPRLEMLSVSGPTPIELLLGRLSGQEVPAPAHTRVTDLAPLAHVPKLRKLELIGIQATDFRVLSKLEELTYLNLSNSSIDDLTPLTGLRNLETLLLDGTKVSELSSLAMLRKLRRVFIGEIPLANEEVEKLRERLPDVEVERSGTWY